MQRQLGRKYYTSSGVEFCTPPTQKELYEARCPHVEYRAVDDNVKRNNGIKEYREKGDTYYNHSEGTNFKRVLVKREPCAGTPKEQID